MFSRVNHSKVLRKPVGMRTDIPVTLAAKGRLTGGMDSAWRAALHRLPQCQGAYL